MYEEVRVQTVEGSFGWLRRWRIQRIRSRFEERLRERERIARELHDTFLQSVQALAHGDSAPQERRPESACLARQWRRMRRRTSPGTCAASSRGGAWRALCPAT